jgi:hypothetical protein
MLLTINTDQPHFQNLGLFHNLLHSTFQFTSVMLTCPNKLCLNQNKHVKRMESMFYTDYTQLRSDLSISLWRWVHTCYVTAYRNAVRLKVPDTIRSNSLLRALHLGVPPVCCGSQKHHERKEDERSRRCWRVMLNVQTCSGRNLSSLWCDVQIPTAPRTCP